LIKVTTSLFAEIVVMVSHPSERVEIRVGASHIVARHASSHRLGSYETYEPILAPASFNPSSPLPITTS
jgi:hypothetical protein